jgi:hypothetical protein
MVSCQKSKPNDRSPSNEAQRKKRSALLMRKRLELQVPSIPAAALLNST